MRISVASVHTWKAIKGEKFWALLHGSSYYEISLERLRQFSPIQVTACDRFKIAVHKTLE
eukprot:5939459-Pleurochrysis_carterae.AAC.1